VHRVHPLRGSGYCSTLLAKMRKRRTNTAAQIVTYRGATYPWQCDHVGHMNII